MAFVDANEGWASFSSRVSSDGYILHTINGGNAWTTQQTIPNLPSRSYLAMLNRDTGYLLGSNIIYKTTNGWQTYTSSTLPSLFSSATSLYFWDTQIGWAADFHGTIYKTNDGGTSWTMQMPTNAPRILNMFFISAQQGWAVGVSGRLLYTNDGGDTWLSQNFNTTVTDDIADIHFISPTRGFLVGANGLKAYTNNAGANWIVEANGGTSANNITAIHFLNPTFGFILYERGHIQKFCSGYRDTISMTACEPFYFGNHYIETSGTYSHQFMSNQGCDSVVTAHITFNGGTTSSTFNHTACMAYSWIDGQTYTSNNNTATFTTTNAAGCDSIITLNLQIQPPTYATVTHESCAPYTWINGQTYTNSGNYTHTVTNAAGCDSIITLQLERYNADNIDIVVSGNIIFADIDGSPNIQWLDCNNNYAAIAGQTFLNYSATQNGDYALAINFNVCADTTICHNVLVSATQRMSNEAQIAIFPNPTTSHLYIQTPEVLQIQIINALGQTQISTPIYPDSPPLDLSNLSAGVYYIYTPTAAPVKFIKI